LILKYIKDTKMPVVDMGTGHTKNENGVELVEVRTINTACPMCHHDMGLCPNNGCIIEHCARYTASGYAGEQYYDVGKWKCYECGWEGSERETTHATVWITRAMYEKDKADRQRDDDNILDVLKSYYKDQPSQLLAPPYKTARIGG
jgi:hypothetical protein